MRRLLAGLLLFAGCGDDPPPEPPPKKPPAAAAAPAPAAPPPVAAAPGRRTKDQILDEVRKRELTNEDFNEGETNRDPFRSFLSTFAVQAPVVGKQHKIVLQKFALDELKLSAIVSGDGLAPKAMFVDPSGMGVMVMRGDHVSKVDATVVRISPDRVFFQWEEDAGGGKSRTVERVIELHAGELATQ